MNTNQSYLPEGYRWVEAGEITKQNDIYWQVVPINNEASVFSTISVNEIYWYFNNDSYKCRFYKSVARKVIQNFPFWGLLQ